MYYIIRFSRRRFMIDEEGKTKKTKILATKCTTAQYYTYTYIQIIAHMLTEKRGYDDAFNSFFFSFLFIQ